MTTSEAARETEHSSESGTTGKVIILKGPPGVGKSYTARKLVRRLPGSRHAIVAVDELLHADQRRICVEKATLATHHAALLARSFASNGFCVVLDYTFDVPGDLALLIDELKAKDPGGLRRGDIYTFHLTASLEEVRRRNQTRRDGTDALPESPLERLYAACEATSGRLPNEVVLDTTKMSTSKVVRHIIEQL
jgi:predicted kinase